MDERIIPDASGNGTDLLETLRNVETIRPAIEPRLVSAPVSAPYDPYTFGITVAPTPETQWFVHGDQLKKRGVTLAITLGLIICFGQSWVGLLGGVIGLYDLVQRLTPAEAELLNRIADWTIDGRKYDYGIEEQRLRDSYEEDSVVVDALIRSLLERKILRRVNDRLVIIW